MADITFEATIDHVERSTSSVNGNPSWWIFFEDHKPARTMSDTGWSYEADNPEWKGARVTVVTTPAGRIRFCKHVEAK